MNTARINIPNLFVTPDPNNYNGTGTNSDYEKAFYWFEKAAENGSVEAMYNLGQCYELGNGIPRNKKKAIHWYTLAADNGDEDALEKLSLLT